MVSNNNFNNKAIIYDKYRPTYSKRYIQFLSSLGINGASSVADVGAGTGKHSIILSSLTQKLSCIEPNEEMLSICRGNLSRHENIQFICSSAEQIPVNSGSFHYITVAQAFHLLDQKKCRKEFCRVLKPNGKVILTWQSKNHSTSLFQETEKVLLHFCPAYCRDIHAPQLTPYSYEAFFEKGSYDFYYFRDDNNENMNEETFVGRTLSASYSITRENPLYQEYIAALRKVFHDYSCNGIINTALSTVIYVGNFRK